MPNTYSASRHVTADSQMTLSLVGMRSRIGHRSGTDAFRNTDCNILHGCLDLLWCCLKRIEMWLTSSLTVLQNGCCRKLHIWLKSRWMSPISTSSDAWHEVNVFGLSGMTLWSELNRSHIHLSCLCCARSSRINTHVWAWVCIQYSAYVSTANPIHNVNGYIASFSSSPGRAELHSCLQVSNFNCPQMLLFLVELR